MGAQVCCAAKGVATNAYELATDKLTRKDQEKLEDAKEVQEADFESTILCLVKLAANGYPKVLRSTYAKRNEFLTNNKGDMDKAAKEVVDKGHGIGTEVKDALMAFIPYVGLPLSILKPFWSELRRGCLIAAVYGHDLSDESVQSRVLITMGVAQGGERVLEKSLEVAVKIFWAALCTKCGLTLAKKLPVGKLVAILPDFESKAKQALIDEFKPDAKQLPESVYTEVLDAKPSNSDLLELLQETGEKSLQQAKDQAGNYLVAVKAKAGF